MQKTYGSLHQPGVLPWTQKVPLTWEEVHDWPHGSVGSLQSETPITHSAADNETRVKGEEWRRYFAAQRSNFWTPQGAGTVETEKSDCKPEYPGFHCFFWSLTVFDHTESYFTVSQCHYSSVCNPRPSGVMYPACLHSGIAWERKSEFDFWALGPGATACAGCRFPSHTGFSKGLLSTKQHQHIK